MKRCFLRRKTPLRPFTQKRKGQLDTYRKLRLSYLKKFRFCRLCGKKATQIHHKRGRIGWRLCAEEFFMAICQDCHADIHANGRWAREKGFILPA